MTKKDILKLEEAIKHLENDIEECECNICFNYQEKSLLDGLELALFLLDNKPLDVI